MSTRAPQCLAFLLLMVLPATRLSAQETRIWLQPEMIRSSSDLADFSGLADEQHLALYEFTPEAHRAMLARKEAEAKERAARDAAMKQAQEELARRPWLDLPPFGHVQLVDEVDCGAAEPGHQFRESPAGASRVETILGRPCRVMRPVEGEASYMAFRIGIRLQAPCDRPIACAK